MSVTIRPYVNGGWEVDIRVELPDGSVLRERKKAPSTSKTAAQRWGEARERVLLVEGRPKRTKIKRWCRSKYLRCASSRLASSMATRKRIV